MLKKIILAISGAVLISGCATISEESCIEGSWEKLGYEDALGGSSRDRFRDISKTCGKYGIAANSTAYRIGYDQGLPLYCTYDKGFEHGEIGRSLKTECREINAVSYIDGYDEGRVIYEIQYEYDLLIEAFEDTREQIIRIDRKFEEEGITDTDRARLLQDRRIIMKELDENRIDIRAYERLQDWPKRELDIPVRPSRKASRNN